MRLLQCNVKRHDARHSKDWQETTALVAAATSF
jgi:hypothetical protein